MDDRDFLARVGRFAECWDCDGGGWHLPCRDCNGTGVVEEVTCGSCWHGLQDWVDVGGEREWPATPEVVPCSHCEGRGVADMSECMRSALSSLLLMGDVLVPKGWTMSLGEEDCGPCLRAMADGADGPFVGFASQHPEDRRDLVLELCLRADPDAVYGFRELGFDHGLLLGAEREAGSFLRLPIMAVPPPADSPTTSSELSPPPTIDLPMKHDELVGVLAPWVGSRNGADVLVEAFVHAGVWTLSMDAAGAIWCREETAEVFEGPS